MKRHLTTWAILVHRTHRSVETPTSGKPAPRQVGSFNHMGKLEGHIRKDCRASRRAFLTSSSPPFRVETGSGKSHYEEFPMKPQKVIDVLSILLADHRADPIYDFLIKPSDLAAALTLAIKSVKAVR
jgi:hypothetical protein